MRKIFLGKWTIISLSLVIIFLAAGFYLNTVPEWSKKTYPDYYNEGVSYYLEGKTEEALTYFNHVVLNSQDPWLKSLAFSQLGTIIGRQAFDKKLSAESRFRIGQYAIEMLKEAIINNPDNQEAKYNLELLINNQPKLFQQMQEEEGGGQPMPGPGYDPGGEYKGY